MDQIKKMTFTKLRQVSFSLLQNEGLHEIKAPRNPQGVLPISSDGDNWIALEQKSNPPKIPSTPNKTPQNSLDQNLTPQRSHAEFLRPSLVVLYSQNYTAHNLY